MKVKTILLISIVIALTMYVVNQKTIVEKAGKKVKNIIVSIQNDIITSKNNIELPILNQINKQPPISQFYSVQGSFVLISKKKIDVKNAPNTKGKTLQKLYLSTRVKPIFIKKVTHDNRIEKWLFITNFLGTENIGWIKAENVVSPKDFRKVTDWELKKINFCKDEYCAKLSIFPNGKVIIKWESTGDGLTLASQDTGHLYLKDNLIWIKKTKKNRWQDFFVIQDDNSLDHEYLFKNHFLMELKNEE